MSEDNTVDRLVQIEQAIDEIVARRSAAGWQAGPVPPPRTADEALVAELATLGAEDWPADEAGERITRSVAAAPAPAGAAAGRAEPEGEADTGGVAEPALPAGPRHPRRGRRRWPVLVTPFAAAAAVLAVVAGVLAVTSGHGGPGTGASSASPSAAAPFASPFRYLGTAETPDQLDCITALVCNGLIFSQAAQPTATADRTTDGGVTWQSLATVPNVNVGARTLAFAVPSCATATDCFVATVQGLAVTTDGGASWSTEPPPAVPGGVNPYIDAVSCATAEDCVIHVSAPSASGFTGTLFSTTDGGRNWTMAAPLPGNALSNIWYLHCDPDGDCIGIGSVLNANNVVQGFQAVSSADNGLTWTVRPPFKQTRQQPAKPNAEPVVAETQSCSDALHCVLANGTGIAVTSDGGLTWQQSALPDDYQGNYLLVSCATGLDCVLAAGPLIATTTDGLTWTPQHVPPAGGSPLVAFVDLSCPSTAGCVAVGVTQQQMNAAPNESVLQGSVISSLPG
jgi:photosystem II stability/assembly factor-like uncharacterized protein